MRLERPLECGRTSKHFTVELFLSSELLAMGLHRYFFIVAILLLASSCAKHKGANRMPAAPLPSARKVHIGEAERGIASWYGEPYHGRRSANGEVFDMNRLTAAHRTMPFGTWLRVENESNHKKVNVRVTDRGPFIERRIIDLSRHAAEEIAMIGPGTARVILTVISPPKGEAREEYGVQIAAWADRSRSDLLHRDLGAKFDRVPVIVIADGASPPLYRVIAGKGNKDEAKVLLVKLQHAGYRGFVLRLDTAREEGERNPH